MITLPSEIPSLADTYGSLLLGMGFTMALWGAATLQLYLYYNNFSKEDKRWLKIFVFVVWILDTAHQVMLVQFIYVYLVNEFGNFLFLLEVDRPTQDIAVISAILEAMVQALFVMRVWRLSNKNNYVTGMLAVLIVAQFAIIMVYFANVYHLAESIDLISKINLECAANAVIATTDILIAGVLVILLTQNRSMFKRTNSILNRLISYTIASGLVTALCAIATLVTAQLFPETFIYLTLDLMMAKLYTNCMLAMLNSRQNIRDKMYGGRNRDQGISIRTSMLRDHLPVHFARGKSLESEQTEVTGTESSVTAVGSEKIVDISPSQSQADIEAGIAV